MDRAGTISGRWALAAGRAAIEGCRICHGPTLPGTRLCTQCKAALKRARQETVSELVPPLNRPTPRAARRPRATAAAPARTRINPLALRGTALVLLLVAAVAVGFGALRLAQPAASLPDTQATPSVTQQPSPREVLPPSRTEPAHGTAPSAEPASATKAAPPQEAKRTAAPAAPVRPASSRSDDVPPAPTARAIALFSVAPEPPPPQPVVAPAPVAPPVPVPDRWQLMADAIAQCGRQGFLAGVICEQRVRLQYCEGYWGQAPQCPNGIANDHGQ